MTVSLYICTYKCTYERAFPRSFKYNILYWMCMKKTDQICTCLYICVCVLLLIYFFGPLQRNTCDLGIVTVVRAYMCIRVHFLIFFCFCKVIVCVGVVLGLLYVYFPWRTFKIFSCGQAYQLIVCKTCLHSQTHTYIFVCIA